MTDQGTGSGAPEPPGADRDVDHVRLLAVVEALVRGRYDADPAVTSDVGWLVARVVELTGELDYHRLHARELIEQLDELRAQLNGR